MADQDLSDITSVIFNRPLDEEEMREFLTYLANELNSNIRYTFQRTERVDPRNSEERYVYPRITDLEIDAQMISWKKYDEKNVCATASFRSLRSRHSSRRNKIDGIEFFTTPGYDLSEIDKGEIELMKDTKTKANEFIEILKERD